jgi:16S rRNA (guanine(527)-N(7))-methyltransferase RsmG
MENGQRVETFLTALNSQSQIYGVRLPAAALNNLAVYYKLLDEWNSRLNLVAPCTPAEFATRHVLESLFLLNYLPNDVAVIDVGSGSGLPIVPCLIARPDLKAMLIESSKKKSVFLRKALKQTGIEKATVLAERFEDVSGLTADFVTCRALDRFVHQLPKMIDWSPRSSTLLLYGGPSLRDKLTALNIGFQEQLLPNSDQRFLFAVRRN